MVSARHLELVKIAVLVTWPILHVILHLRSKFRSNRPIWRRDIAKNDFQYGVRPPSWICKISIVLSNIRLQNGNSHPRTKFDRNQIIYGWDMEIKLFSNWRPSAILNLRKLQFWSHGLYLHVILHLRSKFRINRPIGLWRRDIAKNDFQYGVLRHLEFVQFRFFCHIFVFGMEICICIPNLTEIG